MTAVFIRTDGIPSDLAIHWNRLLSTSGVPNFQYELNYIQAWLAHLKQDWKPILIQVARNGSTCGIVPLMYRDEKRRGLIPYRRVRFLGFTMNDFSTILASPEDMDFVIEQALMLLFQGGFRWELLVLDDLMEGDPAIDAIKYHLSHHPADVQISEGKYYFINLARAFDQVWSETSKKFVRNNFNNARNRIQKAGFWSIEFDPGWDTDRILACAAPIHIQRQGCLNRSSLYSTVDGNAFLKKVINLFQQKDMLRSCWLRFNDRYIAYMLGFEQAGVYYLWNMAFDNGYSRFYPSRLLLAALIEQCHSKGLREFNFMRGESDYKTKWTRSYRKNFRFVIRNQSSLYGRMMCLLERIGRSGH